MWKIPRPPFGQGVAFENGWIAYYSNLGKRANPYDDNHTAWIMWNKGYNEAQFEENYNV